MAHTTRLTRAYDANTGTANTFTYSNSFDVFKETEVVVELDNVILTYQSGTINESASPREYTVDKAAKTIHIGGADLSSGTIKIYPNTDLGNPTGFATYTAGSAIDASDLNNNQKQALRKLMEIDENYVSTQTTPVFRNSISFEGATDDDYETTLSVVDPTADRTITLPNVTGTVITTGDTGTVAHAMLANDAVDGDNIADDSVNSEHYVDASIDLAHLSANSVNSSKIVDDSIVNADINSAAAIAHSKLANVTDGQILVGNGSNVPTAVAVSGDVTLANTGAVTIANDAVEQAMIADDAVGADQLASDAVVNASVASGAAIEFTKLENLDSARILVGNGSNKAAEVAVSGDVTLASSGAFTIANDAVEIGMIGCEQTTISDSDSHIPTSGAVIDYVTSVISPIGGFEVIADDESFPNTIPAAGVVVSITDAAGLQVNSSGVSTNGDALDNSTITINGFPSELRGGVDGNADPYVFQSGAGLMVVSTGSSQTYNYHQAMIRESDFVRLSDDINDFNNRYRTAGSRTADGDASNDEGDLFFDQGTNKMYVHDGSTWGEVTSTGDFKYLVLTNPGTTDAPTLTNATFDLKETSTSGSAASVTSAAQLIVSVNGVIQKANTGTSTPSEGFALSDADTIVFSAAPGSDASIFIVQIGSAVSIPTPGDGTVTAAKLQSPLVIPDNQKIVFGTGSDLQFYHDGSDSYIDDTGTGALRFKTSVLGFNGADSTAQGAVDNDGWEFRSGGTLRSEVNSSGFAVSGTVSSIGATDLVLNTNNGTDSGSITITDAANGDITIAPNGSGKIVLDGQNWPVAAGSAGQVLKAGSTPANLEWGAAGVTIANDANNRITTADGSSGLNGEANLTFDGSTLAVTGNQTVSKQISAVGFEAPAEVAADWSIAAANNAMYPGPMTVASGVTVTVPANRTLTIV